MNSGFDKYYYYKEAVQCPEADCEIIARTYRELRGRDAKVLREDFCGTFALCCEWIKTQSEGKAIGIDLDVEPLAYGKNNYLPELSDEQQDRLLLLNENVLKPGHPQADIIVALNFSYFIFKKRQELVEYYKSVCDNLNSDGMFLVDCFGGSQCQEGNVDETEFEDMDFTYFWDQDNYNPVTNEAKFYIHFKLDDEKRKRERVFSYDWRMWSIAEIREIMAEAGFKQTYVYWEGTDENGEGDGEFSRTEEGEECESWVSYIVGLK